MKPEKLLAPIAMAQPKNISSHLKFRNKTSSGVLCLTTDKDTVEEDQEKAEAVADNFPRVSTQESSLPITSVVASSEERRIESIDIHQDSVLDWQKPDPGKSMGPDNLHPRVLESYEVT
ncbi:unnamed protein product [Trichobilharzia regenti]|nr:unnamed protein product [Trichobilharzia regenti]